VAALSAVMTMAVTAPSVPPALSPIDDSRAAVVEIPDDDVPPPGWDQWVSLPSPAPEPSTGALVVRSDGGAAPGGPADGVGASSSHATLPASSGPAAHPEQELEHAGAPPAHFVEVQAEQELWQELRDHGTSLNRALNEALRIHSSPAWCVFQVGGFSLASWFLLSLSSVFVLSLTPSSIPLPVNGRTWSAGPGRDMMPSTALTLISTGTGGNTTPSMPQSRP
jgi:hypothetical protein